MLYNHLQLCQWQDEFEFLCFILCDIIEPHANSTRKINQTFDLLRFVKKFDKACEDPNGRLRELLQEHTISHLKQCLGQMKQIRNLVAHHVPVSNSLMKKTQIVKESAIATLEDIISRGAERYHVNQVGLSAPELDIAKIQKDQLVSNCSYSYSNTSRRRLLRSCDRYIGITNSLISSKVPTKRCILLGVPINETKSPIGQTTTTYL